jgi:hypothetical protein
VTPPFLSGTLVVRDVVSQGYPFVEAIEAVLPVCDEFLISDGWSTDRTWECLEALAAAYPGKITLYRDEWVDATRGGEVIARMTNRLLDRCAGVYGLNVQANEVLHEDALDELRRLPELYPDTDLFALPFLNLMGGRLVWNATFRRRLFRLGPGIRSRADGYDVGHARWAHLPELQHIAGLRPPGRRHTHYLVAPFYRYRALFPLGYLEKLRTRLELVRDAPEREAYLWRRESAHAEAVWRELNPSTASAARFWDAMAPYFDEAFWRDLPADVRPPLTIPRRCLGRTDGAPGRMRHLLDRWEYPVDETLARLRAMRSTAPAAQPASSRGGS